MAELLVRDIMRIGVQTCRLEDPLDRLAASMLDLNNTAVVVLDEDGDSRGWVSEGMLARAYGRMARAQEVEALTAAAIMDEHVPECPVDIPVSAALQIMDDLGVDHLFFLHRAGGKAWPASVLSWRDVVKALAGPAYWGGQGAGAPRPTPLDLFRQRYAKQKREG